MAEPKQKVKAKPCVEFGETQCSSHELVGTVPLPGPYPAQGQLFVVRYPVSAGNYKYYIKLVEDLGISATVTRFVESTAVRRIRLESKPEDGKKPQVEKIDRKGVQKLIDEIEWSDANKDLPQEAEPRPNWTASVHVPETTPVTLRHEVSVPAALSVEAALRPAALCPHTYLRKT